MNCSWFIFVMRLTGLLPKRQQLSRIGKRWRIIRGASQIFLQRLDGWREEVFTPSWDHPAVESNTRLSRILAIRQTDRARRVVSKSLAHNGIDTRTVLANKVRLAVREVVVASPAGGKEVESVADVTLVAHEHQAALVLIIRLLCGLFFRRHFASVGDATTDDNRVIVFQVAAGPHLADMSCKGASVVLVGGVEVKVVGSEKACVFVVVRVLVDGGSYCECS